MILAVPYGTLADRVGRKKIFLLAIVGCFLNDVWIRVVCELPLSLCHLASIFGPRNLTFLNCLDWFSDTLPVRAVWFGGLWQLIGGGAATFSSVSFVLVADICPAEQRHVIHHRKLVLMTDTDSEPTHLHKSRRRRYYPASFLCPLAVS